MSTIHDALETYLALRRELGSEMRGPAARLRHFVEFLDNEKARVITVELALKWATAPINAASATWAQRLGDVRRFAIWLNSTDSRTEIPPRGLLPERYRRRPPYIYSDEEIENIVREAARLASPMGLRAASYETLFGLLAATGLRIGEALSLDRDDVDLRDGVLRVRAAKFGKSRFVPIHDSTRRALLRYEKQRDALLTRPLSSAFFLSERGTRLTQCSARYNFAIVSRAVGLRPPTTGHRHGHGPRLHDMRHRLAVKTLVRWYREGRNVEHELHKLATYLGHRHVADTYWYLEAAPELLQLATDRATMNTLEFPALLQAFFSDRMIRQRQASPHTIAAYRNCFRLLLRFAAVRLRRLPSRLVIADLDAAFVGEFLDHLEQDRGNSARSRNARLAALRAFFHYVNFSEPAHALHCQRILAIPNKRFERGLVEFLDGKEIDALLRAPDLATWIGRRDRAILLVAVQTGLRVSELTALCRQHVTLGVGAHIRCLGKGRKLRCTPLRSDVTKILEAWLRENPLQPDDPFFPSLRGGQMSADAVERLVARHVTTASFSSPSLKKKRITPHTLRHTAAMQLLQKGVDRSVIALWLGHESIETTQIYLHADLRLKEKALAHTSSSGQVPGRFRPDDALLTFLDSL